MKEKRTIPTPSRAKEIDHAEYYRITCNIDRCHEEGNGCERGFFSLFIQVLNGYDFCARNGLLPWVDFTNEVYCYSDPSGNKNFWDDYFLQKVPPTGSRIIENKPVEVYPLRIWHRRYFRKMMSIINSLNFRPEVISLLQERAAGIRSRRTLGIHLRGTDHPLEVEPPEAARFINEIRKYLPRYDQLYVATDDEKWLRIMKREFGEKVLFQTRYISSDATPVHRSKNLTSGKELGLDALADCFCLAQCERLILVSSNFSFASLLFNPEIPYSIIETPSARRKRWKTKLVYLLDYWGIRKW